MRSRSRVALGVLGVLITLSLSLGAGVLLVETGGSGGAVPVASTSPTDPVSSASVPAVDEGPIEMQQSSTSTPVRVRIPRLGISSSLDRLDVLANGELAAPPRWQHAGWYAGGPHPGETGPAVIAGHVDSPTGPAAFTGLDRIQPGDTIYVDVQGGDTVRFRVDRTAIAPKKSFPTQAVYGPTPDAQLRLITCDGPYDPDAGGYQDNLVVYATLQAS